MSFGGGSGGGSSSIAGSSDVNLSNVQDSQVLAYDGSSLKWENKSIPTGDGDALVYNVRDYGAVGDGQTDDRAALQAAIDQAESGGVIYFPPGIYLVSGSLFGASGTIMRGAGASFVTKADARSDRPAVTELVRHDGCNGHRPRL